MNLLPLLLWLTPVAHAKTIDWIGSGDSSVAAMWAIIRSTFPYTSVGNSFPELILGKVIGFVLSLIGGTAVCILLYAGIQLITGGEEKKAEAKKMATYALGGLALALLADAIVIYAVKLIHFALVGT